MLKVKELLRDSEYNILQDKANLLVALKDDFAIYINRVNALCANVTQDDYSVTVTYLGMAENRSKCASEQELLEKVAEIITAIG